MTTNEIEDIISNWMGELAPPPEPYCTSLDAMARAEKKLKESNLFYRYCCMVAEKVMGEEWQRNFSISFFALLTCPARVRADALAEVIMEMEADDEMG